LLPGAPTDSKGARHVGDLGNVTADANGIAKVKTKITKIKMKCIPCFGNSITSF